MEGEGGVCEEVRRCDERCGELWKEESVETWGERRESVWTAEEMLRDLETRNVGI